MGRSSGFALIAIAFGILSVLAGVSYYQNQAVIQYTRRVIQKLNAAEGFYGGEVALWNGYFMAQKDSLLSGRFNASVDNQYDSSVKDAADHYYASSYKLGQPLNLQRTKVYDSARTVIRRYGPKNLEYTVASNPRTYCGIMKFPPSNLLNGACVAVLPSLITVCGFLGNRDAACPGAVDARVLFQPNMPSGTPALHDSSLWDTPRTLTKACQLAFGSTCPETVSYVKSASFYDDYYRSCSDNYTWYFNGTSFAWKSACLTNGMQWMDTSITCKCN